MIPDWSQDTASGSTFLVIAGAVVCLLVLWNLILRKRVRKYRFFSASQGERYRQFFDNCPDALLVVEHEGSIVSANAQASRLLKLDGQDLLAKTFWDFVPGISRSEFGKQFGLCISGKSMHCEGEIRSDDGTVTPVEVNGSLQVIGNKSLVQIYIRDISVLREVEDQVRSLYNQLDKVSDEVKAKERMVAEETRIAQQEFIAFANHKIRTPLDGIMGMAQLLTDTPLDVEQHNCVYTILNSSTRLLNVVKSMGEASEDASEETGLQAEFVNLRTICETLSRKYEPLALNKGLDFRCDCQSNVPMHVVTDGRLLSRVLSSLLDNAIKFTHQGLVMLNIECRRKTTAGAELYFHVIDTGVGVDKQFQSNIFEMSNQGGDSRFARFYAGEMGLGNSSQVIGQLGGSIGLTSTKGKGATFYFDLTLPLELPEPAVEDADQSMPLSASETGSIESALVLVVDDNKICQKVVASLLRKAGCEVNTARNGKEAISLVRTNRYDVVLMDCQMPVMDGYEATGVIRAMSEPYRSLPIIALTAHSLKHELQACRNYGMDDALVKPVDRKKLIETVNKYALKRRQESMVAYEAAS